MCTSTCNIKEVLVTVVLGCIQYREGKGREGERGKALSAHVEHVSSTCICMT